jgi:hypothetical protein
MWRWPGGAQSPAASNRPPEKSTSKQRSARAVAALTALSLVEPDLAWLEDPDGAPGAAAARPGFLGAPASGAPYLSPPPRAGGTEAGASASERPPPRQDGDAMDEGGAGGDGAGDDGGWVPIVTLAALRRELALARARATAAGGGGAGGGGCGGVGAWSSAEDVAEALMAQGARPAPAGASFDRSLMRLEPQHAPRHGSVRHACSACHDVHCSHCRAPSARACRYPLYYI